MSYVIGVDGADGGDGLVFQILIGIIADKKGAAVKEEAACGLTPADNGHGIGAMTVFRTGLAEVFGTFLHMMKAGGGI